jgi:protein-histidine pros-kinase
MRLRNRLNIILSAIFFFVLTFFAIISYTMEHQQAKEEVLQTAKLILEMAVSIRTYTIEEIAPLLKSSSQNKHMPQAIPSYAAIQTFTHLKKRLEKYEYKESVLNPKNPLHRTTEWEVELIRSFREQPDLKMIIGDRKTHSENSDKKNN